jgi:uncharacterized protein YjbJ (UPF0337 family)
VRNYIEYGVDISGAMKIFCPPIRSYTMNKNQVEGTGKDIAGKVQEEVGKLIGSDQQQIKGLNKQIDGKVQKTVGDVEKIIKG